MLLSSSKDPEKRKVMQHRRKFRKWEADIHQLRQGLSPVKVRDLIVECFYTTQKGMFRALKKRAGIPATEKDVFNRIMVVVKIAFTEVGDDFDNPTKEKLPDVVRFLEKLSRSWGTPKDIVENYTAQLLEIISLLE